MSIEDINLYIKPHPTKEIADYIHFSIFHDVVSFYLGSIYGNIGIMAPSCRVYEVPSYPQVALSPSLKLNKPFVLEVKFKYLALRCGKGGTPSDIRGRLIFHSEGNFQYLVDEAWPILVDNYPFLPLGAVEFMNNQVSVFSSEMMRDDQNRLVYNEVLTYRANETFKPFQPLNDLMDEELSSQLFFHRYTLSPLLGIKSVLSFPVFYSGHPSIQVEVKNRVDAQGRLVALVELHNQTSLRESFFTYEGNNIQSITIKSQPVEWSSTPIDSQNKEVVIRTPPYPLEISIQFKEYPLGRFPAFIEYKDQDGIFAQIILEEVKRRDRYIPFKEQKEQLKKWNPYPRILDLYGLPMDQLSLELSKFKRIQGVSESYRRLGLIVGYCRQKKYDDALKLFRDHITWLKINSHPSVVRSEILQMLVNCYQKNSHIFSPLGEKILEEFWPQLTWMLRGEFHAWKKLRSMSTGLFFLLTLRQWHLSTSLEDKKFYTEQFTYACNEIDRKLRLHFSNRTPDSFQEIVSLQKILKDRFKDVKEFESLFKPMLGTTNYVMNPLAIQRLLIAPLGVYPIRETEKKNQNQ